MDLKKRKRYLEPRGMSVAVGCEKGFSDLKAQTQDLRPHQGRISLAKRANPAYRMTLVNTKYGVSVCIIIKKKKRHTYHPEFVRPFVYRSR